jgi:hypothetical protein
MNKVSARTKRSKQTTRKAPKPGTTPADRRLLAKAKRETAEGPARGNLHEAVKMTREDLLSMSRQIDDAIGFVIDAKTPSRELTHQLGLPPTDWALLTLRTLQHSIIKRAASTAVGGAS